MKKLFLEIKEADQVVAQLYAKTPKLRDTKFGYAWKRFMDKNYPLLATEINDRMTDNRIEFALTDPTTKELLYTDSKNNNFKYSKEGMKSLLDANRKLVKEYDAKEVEIIPFIVKKADLPELTEEEKEILTGLVI